MRICVRESPRARYLAVLLAPSKGEVGLRRLPYVGGEKPGFKANQSADTLSMRQNASRAGSNSLTLMKAHPSMPTTVASSLRFWITLRRRATREENQSSVSVKETSHVVMPLCEQFARSWGH